MKSLLPSLIVAALVSTAFNAHGAQVVTTLETVKIHGMGIAVATNGGYREYTDFSPRFVQITTTSVIDDTGTMMREYGRIEGFSYTVSIDTSGSTQIGTIPGTFPNPPTPIYENWTANGTITLTVPALDFDSGFRPLTWNGSFYQFDSSFSQVASATGLFSYEATSGSNTTSGEEGFTLYYSIRSGVRAVNTANFPTSLSMSPLLTYAAPDEQTGVNMTLASGSVGSLNFTMILIPEPSTGILTMLAGGLLIYRRRR